MATAFTEKGKPAAVSAIRMLYRLAYGIDLADWLWLADERLDAKKGLPPVPVPVVDPLPFFVKVAEWAKPGLAQIDGLRLRNMCMTLTRMAALRAQDVAVLVFPERFETVPENVSLSKAKTFRLPALATKESKLSRKVTETWSKIVFNQDFGRSVFAKSDVYRLTLLGSWLEEYVRRLRETKGFPTEAHTLAGKQVFRRQLFAPVQPYTCAIKLFDTGTLGQEASLGSEGISAACTDLFKETGVLPPSQVDTFGVRFTGRHFRHMVASFFHHLLVVSGHETADLIELLRHSGGGNWRKYVGLTLPASVWTRRQTKGTRGTKDLLRHVLRT